MKFRLFLALGACLAIALFVVYQLVGRADRAGELEGLRADAAASALFDQARNAQLAGRDEEALALLRRLAAARPTDPFVRLQLGILLQDSSFDRVCDPYEAIGEYHAYLTLAPDSDKAETVRARIESAHDAIDRRLGALPTSESDPAAVAALRTRISELEGMLADRGAELAGAQAALADARSKNAALQRDVDSLQGLVDTLQSGGGSFRSPIGTGPDAGPIYADGDRTYRVRDGDTLFGIAQKNYGDKSRWKDIRDANPTLIGANGEITPGSVLVIPQ